MRIIGNNGSGKTTFINLLCGLIHSQTGSILYDNIDMKKISKNSLGNLIGVVSQDIYLFDDTIRNNIIMDNKDISDEDILCLSKKLGFEEIINSKNINLNTLLSNNGKNLSGGQRQKISILRALIKNPQIVIWDEASTFLDEKYKAKLYNYIDNLKKNRIIFIIEHSNLIFGINSDLLY